MCLILLYSLLTLLFRLLATKFKFLSIVVPENVASFWLLQIRRSLLNENDSGFQKAKRPIYYDDGLEVINKLTNKQPYEFDIYSLTSLMVWIWILIAENSSNTEFKDQPAEQCDRQHLLSFTREEQCGHRICWCRPWSGVCYVGFPVARSLTKLLRCSCNITFTTHSYMYFYCIHLVFFVHIHLDLVFEQELLGFF